MIASAPMTTPVQDMGLSVRYCREQVLSSISSVTEGPVVFSLDYSPTGDRQVSGTQFVPML
ncbi:unnamed protein product [Fusarium graminearum]|uniref:Chromosome 4, complete genome n=1 Tax=Gibberella zeae (strain ATCC MYA-4620 / CBS 123657 / FGSC 9075 / NRRL 31084 / PH-1) TaxID=229533 RepID=A0A098DR42_GIBZE|nr:unnamed protein product [Fusarium graminearum]CZS72463.1 unnamed protein product [Fusarium graminearum]